MGRDVQPPKRRLPYEALLVLDSVHWLGSLGRLPSAFASRVCVTHPPISCAAVFVIHAVEGALFTLVLREPEDLPFGGLPVLTRAHAHTGARAMCLLLPLPLLLILARRWSSGGKRGGSARSSWASWRGATGAFALRSPKTSWAASALGACREGKGGSELHRAPIDSAPTSERRYRKGCATAGSGFFSRAKSARDDNYDSHQM